jgi:hypothetical protein
MAQYIAGYAAAYPHTQYYAETQDLSMGAKNQDTNK